MAENWKLQLLDISTHLGSLEDNQDRLEQLNRLLVGKWPDNLEDNDVNSCIKLIISFISRLFSIPLNSSNHKIKILSINSIYSLYENSQKDSRIREYILNYNIDALLFSLLDPYLMNIDTDGNSNNKASIDSQLDSLFFLSWKTAIFSLKMLYPSLNPNFKLNIDNVYGNIKLSTVKYEPNLNDKGMLKVQSLFEMLLKYCVLTNNNRNINLSILIYVYIFPNLINLSGYKSAEYSSALIATLSSSINEIYDLIKSNEKAASTAIYLLLYSNLYCLTILVININVRNELEYSGSIIINIIDICRNLMILFQYHPNTSAKSFDFNLKSLLNRCCSYLDMNKNKINLNINYNDLFSLDSFISESNLKSLIFLDFYILLHFNKDTISNAVSSLDKISPDELKYLFS